MPKRQWRWGPERVEQASKAGELHFSKDRHGHWIVSSKQYLRDEEGQRQTKFFSIIDDVFTQHGTNEILDLFGDAQVFAFPKPSKLIRKLVELATRADQDDVILDFFAGSGATAHAVLDANEQDGGNRKFVLAQLPEQTGRADYPTIAEIARERIRRVANRLRRDENKRLFENTASRDLGFRAFKLAESNFRPWQSEGSADAKQLSQQLEFHINHIRQERTNQDLLFEILLKSGYSLTTPVGTLNFEGKNVYAASDGEFLICLERDLTIDLIRAIADRKPSRVVCLDEGFANNDQLKANAVQIFRSKDVTSFKTV
jgi:adenine-specific DNA-methyltransferase